jgi:hypothetical protein
MPKMTFGRKRVLERFKVSPRFTSSRRFRTSGNLKLFANRSLGILASSLCLLAQFSFGCSKPNQKSSALTFQYESQPSPPHVGSNVFIVKLNAKDGTALSGAHVSLEGNMSHPGMSQAITDMEEVGAGTYRGSLNLSMRGDWIVEFHIAMADGRKVEREAELRNVKK